MSNLHVFWAPAALGEDETRVMVARDRGEVILRTADDAQEIGYYATALPEAVFVDLLGAIDGAGDSTAPQGVMPGTPLATLGSMDGAQPLRMHTYQEGTRPELEPIVERFRGAMEQIRAHPRHVVRAQAEWRASQLSVGDTLEVTLRLENAGSEPVKIVNPAVADDAAPVLSLVLFRIDEEGDTEFLRDEAYTARHCRLPEAAGGKPASKLGPVLSLAPGEVVTLEVAKEVRIGPGAYTANLGYASPAPPDPPDDFASGSIGIELDELEVVR